MLDPDPDSRNLDPQKKTLRRNNVTTSSLNSSNEYRMSGTFWSSGNLFFSHKNCSKNVRYRTPENICSSGEAVHHTLVDRIDDAAASLLPVIAHVGQERFLKHGRLAAGSDWHEGRRYASIPDPDPPIHMFLGLPDPDPISQRYGSRPFYHQAKIVRKNLIRTVL
jgi:hypothetical protein